MSIVDLFPVPTERRGLPVVPVGGAKADTLIARTRRVARDARARSPDLDRDDAFPVDDVRALAEAGLLNAPLPVDEGGVGLGLSSSTAEMTARVLTILGSGSLPLGRLYEGHVNAIKLICAFGTARQITHFARIIQAGHLLAVWNTEGKDGVKLVETEDGGRLYGRKIFASGAGHIAHPLITASNENGELLMVIPTVDDASRANNSSWRPHGMRASASGAVDFTGLSIEDIQVFGGPDDFHAQPYFSAGAWRFAAIQAGGISALFDAARSHLVKAGRADDPHQRARMGAAAIAVQGALQWVFNAARCADDETVDGAARIAFSNLARLAVERAGLEVLELTQRSVGLQSFMRTHPMEQLSRDLATYLRQPNPDKALDDAAAWALEASPASLDLWPWR